MREPTDSPQAEVYGEAEMDDQGRLTIPTQLREDLNIQGGCTFTVLRENKDIRLVRQLPELHTVTAGKDRGSRAFRDAGRGTFGER